MNTQRLPSLAPGIAPALVRRLTSSGCILRNSAASINVSVLMAAPFRNLEVLVNLDVMAIPHDEVSL